MTRKPRRPRDPNELARRIVDLATGDAHDPDPNAGKNPAAVALGRLGGLKGGKARAEKMTDAERTTAAQKAARTRWAKESGDE